MKSGESSEGEALKRLECASYWVWTAMAPESTLLLVLDVGMRTLYKHRMTMHLF